MVVEPKRAIVCMVKTPGFSPVKTRLSQDIGSAKAEEFFVLAVKAIEQTLREAQRAGYHIYWSVAEQYALDHPMWARYQTIWQGSGELGDRLFHTQDQLLGCYDDIFFIGGDSPQICIGDFLDASRLLKQNEFVLAPTEDGGFWLYGSKKHLNRSVWKSIEYSRADTYCMFFEKLEDLGRVSSLKKRTDVDFYTDLENLSSELDKESHLSKEKQDLFNWIKELI